LTGRARRHPALGIHPGLEVGEAALGPLDLGLGQLAGASMNSSTSSLPIRSR
jgi:hypothetical protein